MSTATLRTQKIEISLRRGQNRRRCGGNKLDFRQMMNIVRGRRRRLVVVLFVVLIAEIIIIIDIIVIVVLIVIIPVVVDVRYSSGGGCSSCGRFFNRLQVVLRSFTNIMSAFDALTPRDHHRGVTELLLDERRWFRGHCCCGW